MGLKPPPIVPLTSGGNQEDNDTVTILQTAMTIAGLAAVILALFPAFPSLANFKLFELGERVCLYCSLAILLCGISSLLAAMSSIYILKNEKKIPLKPHSPLGLLLMSLILFFLIYVGIAIKYVHF